MPALNSPARHTGFSLIELVVTVAIIGIISSVAWSMYDNQTLRNGRTDGIRALTTIQGQLERCYLNTDTYLDCNVPASSERGLYTIAIVRDADSYTLTATPAAGTRQTNDTDCTTLTLNNLGQRDYTGAAPNSMRCWGS